MLVAHAPTGPMCLSLAALTSVRAISHAKSWTEGRWLFSLLPTVQVGLEIRLRGGEDGCLVCRGRAKDSVLGCGIAGLPE